MKTLTSIFITLLIGVVLNIDIAWAEDQTSPSQAGESEQGNLFSDHKTKVDPAREAKRMNYMRARMVPPSEDTAQDLTPTSTTGEGWIERAQTKSTYKDHKVFRKQ